MKSSGRLPLLAGALFAAAYVAAMPLRPYPADFVVKSVPAASLALMALLAIPGRRGKLLSAALVFCAGGDAALAYGDGDNLTMGLGLFLVAQVLFMATFTRDLRPEWRKAPWAGLLAAYSAAMAVFLSPSLEDMALPVYVYLAVITAMGITAVLRHPTSLLVICGAVLFIASDSVLAIGEFRDPLPASDYLVMVTYYLALFLITYGMVRAVRPPRGAPG